jgi:hypothetical protein
VVLGITGPADYHGNMMASGNEEMSEDITINVVNVTSSDLMIGLINQIGSEKTTMKVYLQIKVQIKQEGIMLFETQ